ncbi:hypothetical protein L6452_19981 [Arctium lappa]|uniref:Uncharacterized protein n=1 Tax=Arctium lappa TaxID=4217 RepID=A0ACB9BA23_ARCLA|nr:hypothetical protein L6452_19981 [Arctium lappa]
MSELQPPAEGQMNEGGSGAPVSIPADIVVIAPPKRRRRPSVRLDPKASKTRPLVNLTTTVAAAVGGGVPITGEYQGTIDVGEDKDGAGNDNNHHNMMNNGVQTYHDGTKEKEGRESPEKRMVVESPERDKEFAERGLGHVSWSFDAVVVDDEIMQLLGCCRFFDLRGSVDPVAAGGGCIDLHVQSAQAV